MVARDGVEPPTPAFSANITGLRWLPKCFKSRGRQAHLGPGSWAGRTDFVRAAVEPGIDLPSTSEASDTVAQRCEAAIVVDAGHSGGQP